MPDCIRLTDLTAEQIRAIWQRAQEPVTEQQGTVAWSFEGNGIRTRATFLHAFRDLGLAWTELPNLLQTDERVQDMAGYLDPYFDLYVIRAANHARLVAFAAASTRPVINAMSSAGHPCEALADGAWLAAYVEKTRGRTHPPRVALWGPPTNIFRSWYELAQVLDWPVEHFCPAKFHEELTNTAPHVRVHAAPPTGSEDCVPVDVVITDGWPAGFADGGWSLNEAHVAALGVPQILPTPPFTVGQELAFDPVDHVSFAGYGQKGWLLPVQRALVAFLLEEAAFTG